MKLAVLLLLFTFINIGYTETTYSEEIDDNDFSDPAESDDEPSKEQLTSVIDKLSDEEVNEIMEHSDDMPDDIEDFATYDAKPWGRRRRRRRRRWLRRTVRAVTRFARRHGRTIYRLYRRCCRSGGWCHGKRYCIGKKKDEMDETVKEELE